MLRKIFVYLTIFSLTLAAPLSAAAGYFDPNDIFTDKELFDANALSRTAIQQFLESKNSVLKNLTAMVEGAPKLVSEMIYEIGKQYGISQKFLLAKLQHEQGLIEKQTATQNMLDWATGYSCIIGQRCNEKYRGIYNQLDAAAATQQIYTEKSKNNYNYFGYQLGRESTTKDGKKVKPVNQATINLYIYDPYYGGASGDVKYGANYWFWRVWNRYFTERSFPDGAVVRENESGNYYLIENNQRRLFAAEDIYLKDYRPEDAIPASAERLSYYTAAANVEFPNNTIVKSTDSGLTYLLSDNVKRRIAGSNALALLGYHLADTAPLAPPVLSEEKLALYAEGEPVTEQSVYPLGLLAQNESNGIFLIKDNKRYPLLDEAVWQINFKGQAPLKLSNAAINQYAPGEAVKLRDGALVKAVDGKFYIISEEKKHAFTNIEVARRTYGEAAVNSAPLASAGTLALHENGDPIDFIDASVSDPAVYVSYAEQVAQAATEAQSSNYLASYNTFQVPGSFLAGSNATGTVNVSFRNRGNTLWEPGKVRLKIIDENSDASSLAAANTAPLTLAVGPDQIAEFSLPITAPANPGLLRAWFMLEYQTAQGIYVEMRGGMLQKDITVTSPISAAVVKHNIPAKISQRQRPITVTVTLKNTGQKAIWTAKRAAFMVSDENGNPSPFYDKTDWIDKTTVGVPYNKAKIKPNDTGIVKFRLSPRPAPLGTHTLRFNMELRDIKETVYLSNQNFWEQTITVTK